MTDCPEKKRQIRSDDVERFVHNSPTHHILACLIRVLSREQLLRMFEELNCGVHIEQFLPGGQTETIELVAYDPYLPHVPSDS